MKKGNLSVLTAESLGLILVFLMPLKFGTIIGLPSITLSYPSKAASIFFAGFPAPLFMMGSVLFLGASLFAFRKTMIRRIPAEYALLLTGLSIAAVPGALASGTVSVYSLHFLSFFLSMAAFGTGMILLIEHDRTSADRIITALFISFLFSIYSGFSQYFSGFDETLDFVKKNTIRQGFFHDGLQRRLLEHRVSADFSSCNAYAGYLILLLPVAAGFLWKIGSRVEPAKVAKPLITVPVIAAGLFLLIKTGCRGALLSLCTAVVCISLFLPAGRKWKMISAVSIPLGLIAFTTLILLGRGAKSLLFRLDYLQGAFRMMLDSPFTGKGWGNFQNAFFTCKMIIDREAPASPHNFFLTFGASAGIAAFLVSAAVLAVPLWFGLKRLAHRKAVDSFSNEHIPDTAVITGFLAWSIHSMQDILLETPGCLIPATAAACIIVCGEESPSAEKIKKFWFSTIILLTVVTGCMSFRLFRYDFAYAELCDTADIRTLSPERLAQTDLAEVRKLFDKCERLEPDSPFHDMIVSDLLFFLGETDQGLTYLNNAIRKNPGSAPLHHRKSMVLQRMNRTGEARIEMETAHRLAPRNPVYREKIK